MDRFELLELRRDDGILTYHAREIATRRPVQVHVFPPNGRSGAIDLLARVSCLPEPERRRVIDRGISEGRPYLVTDRLAGFASLREWLELKSVSADEQFARLFADEEPQLADVRVFEIPLLALVLGILAALLFLAILVALIAFRPHRL